MTDTVSLSNHEESRQQLAQLEQYAAATQTIVVSKQSDLDPKDRILEEMLPWCREQGNIAVLKSGAILSSDPMSRTVQNCKSLLLVKGIHPGQVYAATDALIGLVCSGGED